MRVGLLTEGGYPYATGDARVWCDRLVRGLAQHEFEVYALSRDPGQEGAGWGGLPRHVGRVCTAPLWGEPEPRRGGWGGRRQRRRFAEHFGELAAAISAPYGSGAPHGSGVRGPDAPHGSDALHDSGVLHGSGGPGCSTDQADRFANGLHGLADLAGEYGGLSAALRSEDAVRTLERACRTLGAPHGAQRARVADLLTVTEALERALRPLSLDWYGDGAGGDPGLSGVDLCHAATGGAAVLPGLLAKRRFGTPLLLTEYGVRLRECYLAGATGAAGATGTAGGAEAGRPLSGPVRSLLTAFHGRLAAEAYARADLITPGNTHTRRWQERCGADRERLRTVYPGMDAARFAEVGEQGAAPSEGDDRTLVWVGRIEPPKDVIALLHAFAEVRRWQPDARLRIIETRRGEDPEPDGYPAHCRALADHLFPDEAADAHSAGDSPVSFERLGDPEVPSLADAYGAGCVVVLSSVVEGFPVGLVEAMFCGRATVSTDVGAVCEVIGGTGLVVPPRNPRALADACLALLSDAERCARLGAAARARALELFTVEQNVAAFRGIYLELMSHCPVPREEVGEGGGPLPFARPAEAHVPGRWTAGRDGDGFGHRPPGPAASRPAPEHTPTWAGPPPPEPLGVGPRPSEEGA
ncbi:MULTISPECIES: DUF3492 domain-containing protein [Streptomyces violaceusniger group]|uniref:D-inositol 3-phosphate glycosyltransferase n=2 Tax=Streptomyces rhizosphaericus TaxID=114699 RepID=A0ABP4B7E7_9ACTN|nr:MULTISPECIES: DUF3492 domain-containing protein [Streptomyces violaceusniger group]